LILWLKLSDALAWPTRHPWLTRVAHAFGSFTASGWTPWANPVRARSTRARIDPRAALLPQQ
jgi:hypothetical protein